MKLADLKVDDNQYGSIDLSKLLGKKILRVEGHISREFGRDAMVFQLHALVLEDGVKLFVEGEHDTAYLPSLRTVPGLENETLCALYEEGLVQGA
jgi:hypothetical protein